MGRDAGRFDTGEVAVAPRGWGFWTEAKLDILSAYLRAFATAGSKKAAGDLIYLDLFAGNAMNERRDVSRDIRGSAVRALETLPEPEAAGDMTAHDVPSYRADPPEPPYGSADCRDDT
ncbi:MAG: hypothetical protein HYX34_11400 [Actinobacteria bacterium]|nr:hypothetical protein [Actinomycetota bacterium]